MPTAPKARRKAVRVGLRSRERCRCRRADLQRRAEASGAVGGAEDASSASRPRGRGPGLPGTAGGRFDATNRRVPRGLVGTPERTTRLDYPPDDIVPTPRHGDDTSGDEGVHPNDDRSSPGEARRAAPLAAGVFVPRPTIVERRDEAIRAERDAAPALDPPRRRDGRRARPTRADVLPRRHAGALRNGRFTAEARGAPPRALRRPADDVDPAPAREVFRALLNRKHTKTKTKNKPGDARRGDSDHRASLPGRPRARARLPPRTPAARGARVRTFPNASRGGDDRVGGGVRASVDGLATINRAAKLDRKRARRAAAERVRGHGRARC